MKSRVPSDLALSRALNTVLERPFWIQTLDTKTAYRRRQDDTDGEEGRDQELCIGFSYDGDAWIMQEGMRSLRFRAPLGGGYSPRVRNALMVLAEAIRRDNKETAHSNIISKSS